MMDVSTPTAGVDPRTALATSIHAAPGVYAVLLGSGISSAAGIPTGWQVAQDMISKVATCEGVDLVDTMPEVWWAEHFGTEPRYDDLLGALAGTDAARQALLRNYFDPPPGAGGPTLPTAGHRALATLCASGRVRVILTTNFDRLLERALGEAGVAAQILATPESLEGMTPLAHAPVTVVKLHGDYAGPMLNTTEELSAYAPPLRNLVRRIFDEYGLLVIGWSATWDVALTTSLESIASRRYPSFWTLYQGVPSEVGQRLIAQRQASIIKTRGADEFLTDVAERIERLDQRAARSHHPTPLRTYAMGPEQSSKPPGWTILPLLQLRAVVSLGSRSVDECGMIGPVQREALVSALSGAALSSRLRDLSSLLPAEDEAAAASPEGFHSWIPAPGAYQSTDQACYRLGSDATFGISSLVKVRLPGLSGGGSVLSVDVGMSPEAPIALVTAAGIWRDALLVVATRLPDALADILPAEGEVELAEIHVLAASTDGDANYRENDLGSRLDLCTLGEKTREPGPSMGFAMRVEGALSEHTAATFVAEAVEQMALANGYLDPRSGLAALRAQMGLVDQMPGHSTGSA